jgi:hypothetical protein
MRPGTANRRIDSRSPQLLSTEMHTETATVLQSLSTSDAEAAMNPRTEELVESGNSQVQEVVKAAEKICDNSFDSVMRL